MCWMCAWSNWRSGANIPWPITNLANRLSGSSNHANVIAAGRDGAKAGQMMDRFAATLLAMLVAAPASAQVMVDGPHLQETCSNPDEVRRAACAGFIGATVDALAPLNEFCLGFES
jgi:hypothetical protein